MKKDFWLDWLGYISFRLLGPFFRMMPLGMSFFLGGCLGSLVYSFNLKRRALVYANLKTAFGKRLSPRELKKLTKDFYRAFGQNLIEVFLIPLVNQDYIKKYVDIEGRQHLDEAFKKGKGVILLGIHEGSWELSNVVCANLGFPLAFFIRQQKFPRLNGLLNAYRAQKGCRLIGRENQTRHLIQTLKSNNAIGMTADQGGRRGVLVDFFGKDAPMGTGAVRLALKHGCTLLVGFYVRIKGPHMKIILEPPFELIKTGRLKEDIAQNLKKITHIFEGYLERYPQEYLWFYKIWKYSQTRNILILSDGKAGHLVQAEAAAKITTGALRDKKITANLDTLEVKFRNNFSKPALTFSSLLAGKYSCQGCLWCLKQFLSEDAYNYLLSKKYDFIISAGSGLAFLNYVIARENLAKSIVIMRPSSLSTKRFDLVIMPKHDKPQHRKNILATDGALNLVDDDYLKAQSESLKRQVKIEKDLVLGMLIGGDNKDFRLNEDLVKKAALQVKIFLENNDAEILVTTSRRTTKAIEELVKKEFANYSRCKFLVVANEKNSPFAVGGILALSKIIIASPESISMVSEAASSKSYALVFRAPGLGAKHKRFLSRAAGNKNIYLCAAEDLNHKLEELWSRKPPINPLRDSLLVSGAVRKIL